MEQIFHFYFLNISRGFVQIRNPQLEAVACKLEPKVEGRIMQLTPEVNIFRIIFFLVGSEYSIFLEYSPQMQPTPEVSIQYFFISNRLSYCWLFELIIIFFSIIFFYFFLEGWQTTVTGVKMWLQGMIWKVSVTNKFNLFSFLFICAPSPCWCGRPEAVSMAIIDEDNDDCDFDK